MIEAQPEQGVVDLAEQAQRIKIRAQRRRFGRNFGNTGRPRDRQLREPLLMVHAHREIAIADFLARLWRCERVERDSDAVRAPRIDESLYTLRDKFLES